MRVGCRSNYIPDLTDETKNLYEAFKKQYSIDPFGETTIDYGNTLIDEMKDVKKKSCTPITHKQARNNDNKAKATLYSHLFRNNPICVSINPVMVAQPTTFRIRFNLEKAD